ncbi:HtaA domain-containing protein [Corynebacterium kutscheri]|uniref:Cell-surface hemin receptor n=1 Tax=Corynebacterium kutscheri TaxID=35755 RepID=A0AB38VQK6_9CORY|nr:HtaA domain-containing protein [Corynebacterium kutscheri]VEH04399.1 Cell-surface hemin receptor [Corynebacterium kutscheri]
MKNQRFRHLLTTTIACATLISLTAPHAFAESVSTDISNVDPIATSDIAPNTVVKEEETVNDLKDTVETVTETDKTTKDINDNSVTTGENNVTVKDAEPGKKPVGTQDRKGQENTLTWGVRSSFNNYSGGPTEMLDGATQNERKNQFTFDLESVTYDKETEKLEAKFKGGVRYQKYCDDNTKYTNCKLDLKIENPRIVISKAGSYVFAKISSKQYPDGNVYTNDGITETKPIAQLYTANADFKDENNKITWSEIPATLTTDGNKTFSDFYTVGGGLDPITFNFDKSKLTGDQSEYKRLSTDNAKYLVSPQSFNNEVLYENHRELFKFKGHVIVATADSTGSKVDKTGFSLLDRDLNEKHFKDVDLNWYGAVTFDEKNGDLYYVKNIEGNYKNVYKIHVHTKTGFSEPKLVYTFNDDVTTLGYNPHTGDVVAVSKKQTAIINSKSIVPLSLPSDQELVKEYGFTDAEHVYGNSYSFSPAATELLPMEDGTFILNANGSSAKKNSTKFYGLMVSINPRNKEKPARFLPESAMAWAKLKSNSARVKGNLIIRFNDNPSEDHAVAQSFRYENGKLIDLQGKNPVRGTASDIKSWGNAFITDEGTVIALDSKDGILKHVDIKTFKKIQDNKPDKYGRVLEDIAIPSGAKTASHHHGSLLQLDEGTFYVSAYDASKGEAEETYVLRKVYDPKFVPESFEEKPDIPDADEQSNSSLSNTWKIILGVFGGLASIVGIFGVVNHFFGEQIRNFFQQFQR